MKILITGYRGFIGQNMVKFLEKDHELTLFEWGDVLPKISGHDWCIHLGAISSTTETNVEKIMRQNYDFSCLIVNECQRVNCNLQFASSASIYGGYTDFKETAPVNPLSPYAWSKYLFERYVTDYKHQWNICVQGFRYFNVYGNYEDHKGTQASPHYTFSKQAKETGVIKLFTGSENFKRDFVPVELVTDLHRQFFDVKQSGIWNIGTGIPTSFEHVARTIAKQYDATIEYIPMPDNIAKHYQKYTCADMTKLNTSLQNVTIF
jgi:ADP-L-glycero-D-manno-heptose 6-epimerase